MDEERAVTAHGSRPALISMVALAAVIVMFLIWTQVPSAAGSGAALVATALVLSVVTVVLGHRAVRRTRAHTGPRLTARLALIVGYLTALILVLLVAGYLWLVSTLKVG